MIRDKGRMPLAATALADRDRLSRELAMPSDVQSDSPRDAAADGQALFIFAGGGTGGHLYPGMAIAEELKALSPTCEIFWAATPRLLDQRILGSQGSHYVPQAVEPFPKKIWRWPSFFSSWNSSCRYWDEFLASHRVSAVLALGGYAAAPAARAASRRKIPVALLNPDAKVGLANRYLARHAAIIFSQWPLKIRGTADEIICPVGVPLRGSLFGRSRAQSLEALALDPTRQTLIITGASLGAATINAAWCHLMADAGFRAALDSAARPWQILHLTGGQDFRRVQSASAALPWPHWKVIDYSDDMASVWGAADLAVSRAGAGSCAELEACGVPAILLPYPYHRDRHQHANAERLVNHGAAIMLEDKLDPAVNATRIKAVILDLLGDEPRRNAMQAAALANGKTDAAREVARWLCRAADRSAGL